MFILSDISLHNHFLHEQPDNHDDIIVFVIHRANNQYTKTELVIISALFNLIN